MKDWTGETYEPQSLRELSPRTTPRIRRTVSDAYEAEWRAGLLWGIALTLMAAFLLGAMALLWAIR